MYRYILVTEQKSKPYSASKYGHIRVVSSIDYVTICLCIETVYYHIRVLKVVNLPSVEKYGYVGYMRTCTCMYTRVYL